MKKKFALLPILALVLTMLFAICVWAEDTPITKVTLNLPTLNSKDTVETLFSGATITTEPDAGIPWPDYAPGTGYGIWDYDHGGNFAPYSKLSTDTNYILSIVLSENVEFQDGQYAGTVSVNGGDEYGTSRAYENDGKLKIEIPIYIDSTNEITFYNMRNPYIGETVKHYIDSLDVRGNHDISISSESIMSAPQGIYSYSDSNILEVLENGYTLILRIDCQDTHYPKNYYDTQAQEYRFGGTINGLNGYQYLVSYKTINPKRITVSIDDLIPGGQSSSNHKSEDQNASSSNVKQDTFKSEAPSKTFMAYGNDKTGADMKVHSVNAITETNQLFLMKYYLGKSAKEILTTAIYAPYEGAGADNGMKRKLVWTDLNMSGTPGQAIDAIVYNQTDGAYVIHGIFTDNKTAVFEGFIYRDASTITFAVK